MKSSLNAKITSETQKIKKLRNKIPSPITILIGGVFGVGKTTLAYNLSYALNIKQRASLGVITKTLLFLQPNNTRLRTLNQLEGETKEFKIFDKQARTVCSIVKYILKISHEDGVDYIMDGVQLHPKFLNFDKCCLYLFLKAPSAEMLKSRLNRSTTHPFRYKDVNIKQVKKLLDLEKFILSTIKESPNVKFLRSAYGEQRLTLEALRRVRNWLETLV